MTHSAGFVATKCPTAKSKTELKRQEGRRADKTGGCNSRTTQPPSSPARLPCLPCTTAAPPGTSQPSPAASGGGGGRGGMSKDAGQPGGRSAGEATDQAVFAPAAQLSRLHSPACPMQHNKPTSNEQQPRRRHQSTSQPPPPHLHQHPDEREQGPEEHGDVAQHGQAGLAAVLSRLPNGGPVHGPELVEDVGVKGAGGGVPQPAVPGCGDDQLLGRSLCADAWVILGLRWLSMHHACRLDPVFAGCSSGCREGRGGLHPATHPHHIPRTQPDTTPPSLSLTRDELPRNDCEDHEDVDTDGLPHLQVKKGGRQPGSALNEEAQRQSRYGASTKTFCWSAVQAGKQAGDRCNRAGLPVSPKELLPHSPPTLLTCIAVNSDIIDRA